MKCTKCKGKFTLKRVRFCPFCGAELMMRPAEHRRVIVLHVELARFSVNRSGLQPPDTMEAREGLLEAFRRILREHRGLVSSPKKGPIRAVFGLGEALGGEPLLALEAAWAIRAAAMAPTPEGRIVASIRVGIAAGNVKVEVIRKKRTWDGPVIQESLDLMHSAPEDQIWVSRAQAKLSENLYQFEAISDEKRGRSALRCVGRRVRWRDAPFVGRSPELQRLRDLLAEATRQSAEKSLLVHGEAGVGKTRLIGELASWLNGQNLPYFTLRLNSAGPAFRPSFAALTRLLYSNERIAEERRVSLWKLAFENPAFWDQVDPAQIHGLLRMGFRSILEKGPAVWFIEDCHRCSASVWAMLGQLFRELADRPMLIVGTSRKPHELFGTSIALSGLSLDESRSLFEAGRNEGPQTDPSGWASRLESCKGNPFFILELRKHVFQSHGTGPGAVPSAPFLVDSALDSLGAHQEELVKQAAVFGNRFPLPYIARMTRRADNEISKLLFATDLFESGITADELVFRHDLVQEAAYSRIDPEARKVWHEEAGDIARELDGDPEEIAYHYLLSGNDLSALRAALAVARRLSRLPRQEDAKSFLAKAEELARKTGKSRHLLTVFETRLEIETPQLTAAEAEERIRAFGSDPLLGDEPHAKDRLGLMLARFYYEKELFDQAEKTLEQVNVLPAKEHALAHALLTTRIQASLGKRKDAVRTATQWLRTDRLTPSERGDFWVILGRAAYAENELPVAVDFYEKCLKAWKDGGNEFGVRKALRNLGHIYFASGEFQKARGKYEASSELSLKLGDVRGYAEALLDLGNVNEVLLAFEAALLNYQNAFEMAQTIHDQTFQQKIRINWAELLLYLREMETAAPMIQEAVDFFRTTQHPYFLLKALRNQAELLAIVHDPRSLVVLDEALSVKHPYAEQLQLTWAKKADILLRFDEIQGAERALEELEKIMKRGRTSLRVRLLFGRLSLRVRRQKGEPSPELARLHFQETKGDGDEVTRLAFLAEALEHASSDSSIRKKTKVIAEEIRSALPEKVRTVFDRDPLFRRLNEIL